MAALMFLSVVSTLILILPSLLAKEAKECAWVIPLTLPPLVAFAILIITVKLHQRFPQMTLSQYVEIIFGKYLGTIIGITYIFNFWITSIVIIREFTDFLRSTMLPHTPLLFVTLVIVSISVYGVLQGIEVIARAVQFVLPLFVIALTIGVLLAIPDVKLTRLLPLCPDGILPLLGGSLTPAAFYGEVGLLAWLLPHLNKPEEAKKKVGLAIIAIASFLTIDVAITIGIYGAELSAKLIFPFWSVFRNVEYTGFIQRFESLIVFAWITGIVIKITLFNYITALCVQHTFKLRKLNSALYPVAVLELPGAVFMFSNSLELEQFLSVYTRLSLINIIVIPAIMLGVAVVRKLKMREVNV